jgi:hypothetical protein
VVEAVVLPSAVEDGRIAAGKATIRPMGRSTRKCRPLSSFTNPSLYPRGEKEVNEKAWKT